MQSDEQWEIPFDNDEESPITSEPKSECTEETLRHTLQAQFAVRTGRPWEWN